MLPDALTITRLLVRADRIVCEVALAPSAPRTTSPALMERILPAFPTLLHHACVNDAGTTFSAAMMHTSLPHLLEHMVIDLQVRTTEHATNAVFVGTTEWIDEAAGRARIEVSFADDLVALRAFRDATRILNKAVVP